ncbi:hypothetical protein P7K49_034851, partial [Saguinus oedipus]
RANERNHTRPGSDVSGKKLGVAAEGERAETGRGTNGWNLPGPLATPRPRGG